MKLSCIAAVAAVSVTAAGARVDARPKAHSIKADLLCGTFVDNTVKQPLTGKKVGKLTDPIACAMHVSEPNEPSHMGNVHTVRHPRGGKKIVNTGKTDDFGADSAPDKQDFEFVMQPTTADDNGEVAYLPCEDFDIVGTISDDLGVYFTKTIKIKQSCPKPKPVSAKVECEYEVKGGATTAITKKTKERPNDLEQITCTLSTKDSRLSTGEIGMVGRAKWEQYNDDGSHAPASDEQHGAQVHSDGKSFTTGLSFDATKFPPCQTVDLELSITDGDRATLYSTKVHTQVTCGE